MEFDGVLDPDLAGADPSVGLLGFTKRRRLAGAATVIAAATILGSCGPTPAVELFEMTLQSGSLPGTATYTTDVAIPADNQDSWGPASLWLTVTITE